MFADRDLVYFAPQRAHSFACACAYIYRYLVVVFFFSSHDISCAYYVVIFPRILSNISFWFCCCCTNALIYTLWLWLLNAMPLFLCFFFLLFLLLMRFLCTTLYIDCQNFSWTSSIDWTDVTTIIQYLLVALLYSTQSTRRNSGLFSLFIIIQHSKSSARFQRSHLFKPIAVRTFCLFRVIIIYLNWDHRAS